MNFLNEEKDLQIVAHNVGYDRDSVLAKAFKKVGNEDKLPSKDRWDCTQEMALYKMGSIIASLDELLWRFGLEERDEEEKHDALKDCFLTG